MILLFIHSVTAPSTHLVLGDLVGLSARLTMTKGSLPARSSQSGGEMNKGMTDKTCEKRGKNCSSENKMSHWRV